jgi:hypothetical protein
VVQVVQVDSFSSFVVVNFVENVRGWTSRSNSNFTERRASVCESRNVTRSQRASLSEVPEEEAGASTEVRSAGDSFELTK